MAIVNIDPKNPVLSMEITQAKGIQLDMIGNFLGLERKEKFKFFRESDKSYCERIRVKLEARFNELLKGE